MTDWLNSLWSTDGFVPRKECGAWTPGWVALHTLSDVLIWLAYLSIPLVLLTTARHAALRPLRPLLWLFAAFIVSCGTVHLIEAIIFDIPVYRLSGVVKGVTAVVSWATVFALVPALRRGVPLLDTLAPRPPAGHPDPDSDRPRVMVYALAVLVGLLAVLVRFILDPLIGDMPAFGVSILAITFMAWYGGFGPGLVTLLVSAVLYPYLFLSPRYTLLVEGLNQQISLGLFVLTGLGVLVLGELQRQTRWRLQGKMAQLRAATSALATEKAAADRALAQLDALVRNAPYGIAFFDEELRYLRVNETFARANGMGVPDHFGRRLTDVRPATPPALLAEYHDVRIGGPPLIGRVVVDGQGAWEVSAFTVPIDQDRIGLAVIGQDVTDRHTAAERVRESEGRFRQLAEAMPQIVWVTRPDGHHEYFNARWYEFTGLTPEQSLGGGWSGPLHPDDAERSKTRWQRSTDTGEPYEIEYRLRRHDGAYEWFLGRALPVRDASGRIVRWLGTCTGIDEQVKTAQALKASETRFRQLADAMPQIVYVNDADGRMEYINRQWVDYTGRPDATPETVAAVLHPDDLPALGERWRRALAAAAPMDAEFRLRRATDGEYRWFLTRSVPVFTPSGRVEKWVGTSTDIHDQKRIEDDLREAKRFNEEVLNSLPTHVTVIDADGRIVSVNRSWRQFGTDSGLRPGHEWVGTSYFAPTVTAGPGRPNAELTTGILSVLSGERAQFDAEYPSPSDDGERHFHLRANRFRGQGPVRVVVTHEDVTDRVRAEQHLREATRFNESVLHSLPGHLAVIEEDGHILSVNESWRQFGLANGTPPEFDWTAANYFDACRRDEYGSRAEAGIRAVARGERGGFEMEYPCHGNGVERYFLLRANRFRGDGPVRLVITHENITERVVAERQAREGASQLAQLTEGVPLLMWACRPTGECDYLSRQWLDYTGRGLVEQLGYGWMDAVHPEDREHTAGAWTKAVAAGGGYEVEFRLRRHDGAYRWFAVRGIPLRDQAGAVVRWFGSCTDVTDRVQQEELLGRLVEERTLALHEQKIFLNAILDNVAEGIVACDADGKLQLFNAATRRIHGLPMDPLPAERWVEHYHLFEADGVTPMPTDRVPLMRAWRGEEVRDAEMVVRANGHPDRYLVCFGQQLRGQNGQVFGAVVSMRDMTERREHERELVRTADALRVSNEELEKFAYIASHDLQEPLRKIQAFGTRLSDKFRGAVGEQGKDYIDRMLDSAGRMRKLIEDLLAFSRVTSRGMVFQPVDLNAVARDVLSDLEVQVTKSGGRVDISPLPTLLGDTSQLRQVLQNLIGNALKFAKPDVPPVVTVTATPFDRLPPDTRPDGNGWRITVADNGIGFDPQYGERIFELFQRLHGRGEYDGTGLGLAIVRKIVVRHGATITAHSRLGEGAVFRIDWPLAATAPGGSSGVTA